MTKSLAMVGFMLVFAAALQSATISVNSLGDTISDSDPNCTLREAILSANDNSAIGGCTAGQASAIATDLITFSASGTIVVSSPLPIIAEAVNVQGTLGSNVIDGVSAGAGAAGLTLGSGSGGSTIRGLVIGGFHGPAIDVQSSDNTIAGNRLNTNADGTANFTTSAAGCPAAVHVRATEGPIANVTIGGTTAADRNLIAASSSCEGIRVDAISAAVDGTTIQGNYVNVDAGGTVSLSTALPIRLTSATNTLIGGTNPTPTTACTAPCNLLVSGQESIVTNDGGPVTIQGNFMGVRWDGAASLGSTGTVVARTFPAQIGGTAPGQGNVMGGLLIRGSAFSGCAATVQGNRIGTDAAGTYALTYPMPFEPYVTIYECRQATLATVNVILGGTTSAAANLIVGAITLYDASGNRLQGNLIGVRADRSTPLLGGGYVLLRNNSNNNIIGAETSGGQGGNIIAHGTSEAAAAIQIPYGVNNRVSTNAIYANNYTSETMVDLSFENRAANDACDTATTTANRLQNYPVLTAATTTGSSVSVVGSLNSLPNATFTIELYATAPSFSSSEAQQYIGSTSVTTDSNCEAAFNVTLPVVVPGGWRINALAIRADNNTSELSPAILVASSNAQKADFDLDGHTDIVLRNYQTGQNAVWFMNGNSLESIADLPALSNTNWRIEGTANFGGDLHTDVLLRNYITGQNAVWILNGTSLVSIVDLPALPNIDFHFEGTG
ncbi:MAG TPA: CSLREA domain-containing protein, partial [Thermoanaerobaculia bacterium]